jgi:hypothetical protein
MSIFELAYISTASPHLTDSDVTDIVDIANINNALSDISGVLFYNGVNFAQILEGNEQAVRRLYNHLCEDPRHTGVICLLKRTIAARAFAGWSMAYICSTEDLMGKHSAFTGSLTASKRPANDPVAATVEELKHQALAALKKSQVQ